MSNLPFLKENKDDLINKKIEVKIAEDSLLLAAVGPLGPITSDEEYYNFSFSGNISIYVVKEGDSVSDIAKMFNVSSNTILWANEIKKGDKLKVGDVLIILPVDGIKHTIKKGETISKIASLYEVNSKDIYDFNNLGEKDLLKVGQEIIIPGAVFKETEAKKSSVISSSRQVNTSSTSGRFTSGGSIPNNYYTANNTRVIPGYFIKPIPCRTTQNKHNRYAVDLSCGFGTPIKASASGRVIFAKSGWNGAFGNLVIIQHPNNTQTFYAHLSKINVSMREQVSQGQIIGNVGNTGRSTGPHLHFEVRGARNPGFDNSWAN